MRGLAKVGGEFSLTALAYNLSSTLAISGGVAGCLCEPVQERCWDFDHVSVRR